MKNDWTKKIAQLQNRIDYLESRLQAAADYNVTENQRLLKLTWEQIDRAKEASAGEEGKR